MRQCWTRVFIYGHKNQDCFVFIDKIFMQSHQLTWLSHETLLYTQSSSSSRTFYYVLLSGALAAPPPHLPGLHEWGKRSHSISLSSTVPRWPAQQHTLSCVLVQLTACRFPSSPQSTPPLINRAQSDLSARVCVCVRACHNGLDSGQLHEPGGGWNFCRGDPEWAAIAAPAPRAERSRNTWSINVFGIKADLTSVFTHGVLNYFPQTFARFHCQQIPSVINTFDQNREKKKW